MPVKKPKIFQWIDHSSGVVVVDIGRQFHGLPPKIQDEDSGDQRSMRRLRLRLSSDGLSIGGFSLRWIDIGEISSSDNVIEIFVVPVRQDPEGCTIMRHMKTTYSLQVPSGRMPEIESAIRQFMKRWKPRLKGPFNVMK